MLGNGLHAYTTLTCFGKDHLYLLVVIHVKKGWYAIEAYQPFYAFSKCD
jgi:hypothetical protein